MERGRGSKEPSYASEWDSFSAETEKMMQDENANIDDMLRYGRIDAEKAERFRKEIRDKAVKTEMDKLTPESRKWLEDEYNNIDDMLSYGRIDAEKAERFKKEVRERALKDSSEASKIKIEVQSPEEETNPEAEVSPEEERRVNEGRGEKVQEVVERTLVVDPGMPLHVAFKSKFGEDLDRSKYDVELIKTEPATDTEIYGDENYGETQTYIIREKTKETPAEAPENQEAAGSEEEGKGADKAEAVEDYEEDEEFEDLNTPEAKDKLEAEQEAKDKLEAEQKAKDEAERKINEIREEFDKIIKEMEEKHKERENALNERIAELEKQIAEDANENAEEGQEVDQAHINKAKEVSQKGKQSEGFKGFLKKHKKKILLAITGILATGVIFSSLAGSGAFDRNNDGNIQDIGVGPKAVVERVLDEQRTRLGEIQEAHQGIYDGYGEYGMYQSENKPTPVAFASAVELGKVHDNNPIEIIKDVNHNQVESLADHLANIPDSVKDEYGLSNWKGMSILETEKALEALSDEDYDKVEAAFDHMIDQAKYRQTTLNGQYDNAFMRLENADGGYIHENMDLVKCTTTENGTRATEVYWVNSDGQEIGNYDVKIAIDDNGEVDGGCVQVVTKINSNPQIYTGMKVIPAEPSQPDRPSTPPVAPVQPNQPSQPDQPVQPEQPDQPDQPVQPEQPDQPDQPEVIQPKDADNLERIDEQINDDIAEGIGTEEVNVEPVEEVTTDTLTEQPDSTSYEGTEPVIVQNETAPTAEPVQEQVSPENTYSENLGGANADQYAPVQSNEQAQQAADTAEIPQQEAPTGGQELSNVLDDLGIN